MQLPNYRPKDKLSFKCCSYLDCGKEFYGRPVQKYCEFHTDPHNRKRIRLKSEGPAIKNQLFFHNFHNSIITNFVCALDGCSEIFQVKVYPKQHIYPKYCEKHRTEYQRENFHRMQRLKLAS